MKIKLLQIRKVSLLLLSFFLLTLAVSAVSSSTVSAQRSCPDITKTCTDPALANCATNDCNLFKRYINPFIKLITILIGMAITIGIIYGGIIYATSGGDPQKVAGAKNHIRNAVVAFIVYLFLFAAIQFLLPGSGLFKVTP